MVIDSTIERSYLQHMIAPGHVRVHWSKVQRPCTKGQRCNQVRGIVATCRASGQGRRPRLAWRSARTKPALVKACV